MCARPKNSSVKQQAVQRQENMAKTSGSTGSNKPKFILVGFRCVPVEEVPKTFLRSVREMRREAEKPVIPIAHTGPVMAPAAV